MMRRPSLLVPAVVGLLSACEIPVVGAECREHHHLCDGRCVLLTTDEHCGDCETTCADDKKCYRVGEALECHVPPPEFGDPLRYCTVIHLGIESMLVCPDGGLPHAPDAGQ